MVREPETFHLATCPVCADTLSRRAPAPRALRRKSWMRHLSVHVGLGERERSVLADRMDRASWTSTAVERSVAEGATA